MTYRGEGDTLVTAISSVIVFGLIVMIHELGHFITAKLTDMKVYEFSLGFGPLLYKTNKGETQYSLRVFPLGGYVKIAGEDENTDDERSIQNKPLWARVLVILAGPVMNFVLAAVLIASIGFFTGVTTTVVDEITPGQPAEKAGIKPGDKIISIGGQKVSKWEEVVTLVGGSPGKTLDITFVREGKNRNVELVPLGVKESNGTERGVIGIKSKIKRFNPIAALSDGISRTYWMSTMILKGLILMIMGKMKADIIGPVGIVQMVGQAAQVGVYNLLYLASIISVNLGLFNLLPIPALDGSRLVFYGVEWLRGKPIDPEKEGLIHVIGFTLLIVFMILIAYKDILKLNLF
jgi:regulator of sigma E protease